MSQGILAISIIEIDVAEPLSRLFYPGSSDKDKKLAEKLITKTLKHPRSDFFQTVLNSLRGLKVPTDEDGILQMLKYAVSVFGDINTELDCEEFRSLNGENAYWDYVVLQFEAILTAVILTCFSDLEFEIYIAGLPSTDQFN